MRGILPRCMLFLEAEIMRRDDRIGIVERPDRQIDGVAAEKREAQGRSAIRAERSAGDGRRSIPIGLLFPSQSASREVDEGDGDPARRLLAHAAVAQIPFSRSTSAEYRMRPH